MSRRGTDHVVYDSTTRHSRCLHCGAEEAVTMPISIKDFCKHAEQFVKAHRKCQPTGIDSEDGSHDDPAILSDLEHRADVFQRCLPESPFKEQLKNLHEDMLAEIRKSAAAQVVTE